MSNHCGRAVNEIDPTLLQILRDFLTEGNSKADMADWIISLLPEDDYEELVAEATSPDQDQDQE